MDIKELRLRLIEVISQKQISAESCVEVAMIYEKYILSDHPDKEESPDDSRKDGRKKGKRNTLE